MDADVEAASSLVLSHPREKGKCQGTDWEAMKVEGWGIETLFTPLHVAHFEYPRKCIPGGDAERWNNGQNRPHWPVQPVWPVIQFPVQHSASPPSINSNNFVYVMPCKDNLL